jgi:type II secretory pathway pseudopilin PulG
MPRQRPHLKRLRFTMIELMAVITLMAILLTMTMTVLKTDSTKANASVIGGALNYAQAYSMSNLKTVDEYIQVSIDSDEKSIQVIQWDEYGGTDTIIETYSMKTGSVASKVYNTAPSAAIEFFFNYRGEPIEEPGAADKTNELETDATNLTIYSINPSDLPATVAEALAVYIKPFTGKITYY